MNAEVFNKELAEIVKKRADFKNTAAQIDSEKAKKLFTGHDKVNGVEVKFDLPHLRELNNCCRDYLSKLNKEELDKLVREAIKLTPAWKTRQKYGFTTLGDTDIGMRFSKDQTFSPVIRFKAVKESSHP